MIPTNWHNGFYLRKNDRNDYLGCRFAPMKKLSSKSGLPETLLAETQYLQAAWNRHDGSFLNTYLIRDVEDPRINIQSVLTRHFLIQELFQERYALIMEHELYYALLNNWVISLLKSQQSHHKIQEQLSNVLDELLNDTASPNTSMVPAFIANAFKKLAFPNYISDLLMWIPRDDDETLIPNYLLNTFEQIWVQTLAQEQAAPVRVLEAACGSANDYRFLDRYGISRFLNYTGLDLCSKNIQNAKKHFPTVDFQVGSVFDIPAKDEAFDFCFVHDLFEHLSPEGIDQAITEISRVTAQKACLHFFNMDNTDSDTVRKKDNYYWNRLSCQVMQNRFEHSATSIEYYPLDSWLNEQFAYPYHYNKNAYSWQVHFKQQGQKQI